MSESGLVLRVTEWDRVYETKGTLKKVGPLKTIPVGTDLGNVRFQRLLQLPGGLQAYAVWNILLAVAARCSRRGVFAERGVPLTAQELAANAHCAVPVLEQAVKLLRSPGVDLLERVPLTLAQQPAEVSPVVPRQRRARYALPFTHCPNCKADLMVLAQQMIGCHEHGADCGCKAEEGHEGEGKASDAVVVAASVDCSHDNDRAVDPVVDEAAAPVRCANGRTFAERKATISDEHLEGIRRLFQERFEARRRELKGAGRLEFEDVRFSADELKALSRELTAQM